MTVPHLVLLNAFEPVHAAGMSESGAPLVVILLSCVAGLLVGMVILLVRMSRRLTRIDRRLAEDLPREQAASPSPAETSVGGAFETFLSEDPTRRTLPKGEQFAAYRRWRHEHGLNWSNS
jgi:hypothetical protein